MLHWRLSVVVLSFQKTPCATIGLTGHKLKTCTERYETSWHFIMLECLGNLQFHFVYRLQRNRFFNGHPFSKFIVFNRNFKPRCSTGGEARSMRKSFLNPSIAWYLYERCNCSEVFNYIKCKCHVETNTLYLTLWTVHDKY